MLSRNQHYNLSRVVSVPGFSASDAIAAVYPSGVYTRSVKLEENDVDDIINRLRRIEGQIRGIQGMLEDGRDCSDVITQFSASMNALERAGYRFFAATMAVCALDPDQAEREGYDQERLQKLFMQLT